MRAPIALLILLAACQSTAERCGQIPHVELINRLHREQQRFDRDMRDSLRRRFPDDSSKWGPAPDSASYPPVRPSDLAWYNEHCWEGKPR